MSTSSPIPPPLPPNPSLPPTTTSHYFPNHFCFKNRFQSPLVMAPFFLKKIFVVVVVVAFSVLLFLTLCLYFSRSSFFPFDFLTIADSYNFVNALGCYVAEAYYHDVSWHKVCIAPHPNRHPPPPRPTLLTPP